MSQSTPKTAPAQAATETKASPTATQSSSTIVPSPKSHPTSTTTQAYESAAQAMTTANIPKGDGEAKMKVRGGRSDRDDGPCSCCFHDFWYGWEDHYH